MGLRRLLSRSPRRTARALARLAELQSLAVAARGAFDAGAIVEDEYRAYLAELTFEAAKLAYGSR